MKILLVTPTFLPDVGGVETMLVNLCDYFAKRKFYVNLITYSPLIARTRAPLKERLNNYVTVWRIPWVGFGLFNIFERIPPIQFLYLVPGLLIGTLFFLSVSRWRPDIIHVFGFSGAVAGGASSRIYKIPCVFDMCTVYRLPQRPLLTWFVKRIFNWCDYIRANNLTGEEELLKIGINKNKIGVISPPVDETIFKPMPQKKARRKLNLPPKDFIALFVGRMVPSKRVDIAVAATRLVKNRKTKFLFIGEGPLQHIVEGAAKDDDRIIYKGSIEHNELVKYYSASDILMCAPVDKELLGFVGREALMCGLPILAPNIAIYFNLPYSVKPGLFPLEVGCLIDSAPETLASYLKRLISQKEKRKTPIFNRQTCRKFAINRFSNKAMDWLGDSYNKAREIYFSNKL